MSRRNIAVHFSWMAEWSPDLPIRSAGHLHSLFIGFSVMVTSVIVRSAGHLHSIFIGFSVMITSVTVHSFDSIETLSCASKRSLCGSYLERIVVAAAHQLIDRQPVKDVKRWLGELRGKDMPDSFAWSYKRSYKSGYVWQDLKDEDLITPISDNEYILKGSFLQFRSITGFPYDQTDTTVKAAEKAVAEHQVVPEPKPEQPEMIHIEPPRQSDRESPVQPDRRSRDHVDRRMTVFRIDAAARKQQQEEEKRRLRRSYSSRASHVFRNILTCGAADANLAVLMPGGGGAQRRRSTSDMPPRQQRSGQQGSEGVNYRRKSRSSGGGSTGYKPLRAPNCSQCGRQFDPEKFHAHMQSCRGHGGSRRKGRPSTGRVSLRRGSRSEEDLSAESISGYLN